MRKLLSDKFLDKELLISETHSEIVNWKPCTNLESNTEFISRVICKLAEILKLDLEFYVPGTARDKLLRYLVRVKFFLSFSKNCAKNWMIIILLKLHIKNATNTYKLLRAPSHD